MTISTFYHGLAGSLVLLASAGLAPGVSGHRTDAGSTAKAVAHPTQLANRPTDLGTSRINTPPTGVESLSDTGGPTKHVYDRDLVLAHSKSLRTRHIKFKKYGVDCRVRIDDIHHSGDDVSVHTGVKCKKSGKNRSVHTITMHTRIYRLRATAKSAANCGPHSRHDKYKWSMPCHGDFRGWGFYYAHTFAWVTIHGHKKRALVQHGAKWMS